MSMLERCPYYREYGYSKMTKVRVNRLGPTLGVHLREMSVL